MNRWPGCVRRLWLVLKGGPSTRPVTLGSPHSACRPLPRSSVARRQRGSCCRNASSAALTSKMEARSPCLLNSPAQQNPAIRPTTANATLDGGLEGRSERIERTQSAQRKSRLEQHAPGRRGEGGREQAAGHPDHVKPLSAPRMIPEQVESGRQHQQIERRGQGERGRIQHEEEHHEERKKRAERKARKSNQAANGGRVDAQPEIPAKISLDEVLHRVRARVDRLSNRSREYQWHLASATRSHGQRKRSMKCLELSARGAQLLAIVIAEAASLHLTGRASALCSDLPAGRSVL